MKLWWKACNGANFSISLLILLVVQTLLTKKKLCKYLRLLLFQLDYNLAHTQHFQIDLDYHLMTMCTELLMGSSSFVKI